MENDDYHFKFKVVVLGDKAVGKTSFLDCIRSFYFSHQSVLRKGSVLIAL